MKKKDKNLIIRIDDNLLRKLDRIPNKSSYIRKLIKDNLEKKKPCPRCNGQGYI